MSAAPQRFAQLLTEGIHRIRLREHKTIQAIQDELGYAIGKKGGSAIEYWRKGHIPSRESDIDALAEAIAARGEMSQAWIQAFRQAAGLVVTVPSPTTTPPQQPSPFVAGPPILQPGQFFGRNYEIGRILQLLTHFPMQHGAVTGLRRSGKTSLLHFLRRINNLETDLRPDQDRAWIAQAAGLRWVYVDFQDPRMGQLPRLLTSILSQAQLPVPSDVDLLAFFDSMADNLKSPTVILLDEIESALAYSDLDQRFWGSLRSLVGHVTEGRLAYIVSSADHPAHQAQRAANPSPFFNIFGHVFRLGPFTQPEAAALVHSGPFPVSAEEEAWLLKISGCWPYLLQILCSARMAAWQGRESGDWRALGLELIQPYRYLLEAA